MDTFKHWFSTENRARTITILVGAVIILVAGYFLVGRDALAPGNDRDTGATSTSTTTSTGNTGANSQSVLKVETQNPSSEILIKEVTFTTPGWVVIYNDNEGEPGSILGAQYFAPGTYTNGAVGLFMGTIAGETYYAVLHGDDGVVTEATQFGSHPFDLEKDLPLIGEDKGWIVAPFQISQNGARG